MSSRYPPLHDSRYPPNDRSRSPPRFQDRRPSGPFNQSFGNRQSDFGRGNAEPPRGPKNANDAPRGLGPPGGSSAPLGPRGRGGPAHLDYPELRNAPPLGTGRDRVPAREREFDRRGRIPSPPRPRSPPRNFRETLPPRELDNNRPRRDSRDGPASASSTYSDPPPFMNPAIGRGSFSSRGRGRGRGDFDFRDRGRRPPFDDRNTFRPRERSPPPRWARDGSREPREEWRPDRREEERWPERDDRDREVDRFRRDQVQSRFEPRGTVEASSRPPTPHQQTQVSHLAPNDRVPLDPPRDELANRRSSLTNPPPVAKEQRRDPPPQNDLLAGRAEASSNRYGARGSSPPPQAPSVPAFGSVSFKPATSSAVTSSVWKAPQDIRPPLPPPAQTSAAPSAVPFSAPIAPKAQLTAPPPAAPKAPRALEQSQQHGYRDAAFTAKPWTSQNTPAIPTAPLALRNEERPAPPPNPSMSREIRTPSTVFQSSAPSAPTSPRPSFSAPKPPGLNQNDLSTFQRNPSRKWSDTASAPESRADRADLQSKLATPPPSAPSGPRHSFSFSTSPRVQNPNVPTAPRADRVPPTAPRGPGDRVTLPAGRPAERLPPPPTRPSLGPPPGPLRAWNQWVRPGVPVFRESVVPAKRDFNGDEKDQYRPEESSRPGEALGNESIDARTVQTSSDHAALGGAVSDRELLSKTVHPSNNNAIGPQNSRPLTDRLASTIQNVDSAKAPTTAEVEASSSEDDGMDLDEDDFESTRAKFEEQKGRLQSQLIDLSARQYRSTTPLEQIARLARISERDLPTLEDRSPSADDLSLDLEDQSRSASQGLDEDADQDLLTPKEEDLEDVIMDDDSDILESSLPLPRRMRSPEVISLPYLVKSRVASLSGLDSIQENLARQERTKSALVAQILAEDDERVSIQQDLTDEYLVAYRQFQILSRQLDNDRVEKEKAERQKSADPGPEADLSIASLELTSESSRRLHKFSSEYDIQKVLKESEETARVEQEKLDQKMKKARDDLEREAEIPEMLSDDMRQRRIYKDTNNYRSPHCLPEIYGYEPPVNTFSEQEHKMFLETFKERPKKWGEIAAVLPGRTYQDCIHHYYAFKWDGRFRETKNRRKARIGRGRGGKQPRVRGAALMADLSRTEDDVGPVAAGLSESGRPKRAATRTTYGDKEGEAKSAPLAATPAKKVASRFEANGDAGSEKPIKRRKAATADKVSRKARAQPLAAVPTGSPLKVERDLHFRPVEMSKEDMARVEEASLLAGLQYGHDRAQMEVPPVYSSEVQMRGGLSSIEGVERSRMGLAGSSSLQRSSASSYWSVPEQQDFMKFIAHFGTDFNAIATHMGTKTQTMVKNYYQRHADSGNRQDLIDAGNHANARRERGDDMGVPPVPTPIVKRRYDNPQPPIARTLAPHADPTELEDAAVTPSVPPLGYPPQPRHPAAVQTPSAAVRPAPTTLQPAAAVGPPKQAQSSEPRPTQTPGPKMGFFTESRTEQPQRPSARSFLPARHVGEPTPPAPPTQMQQQQTQQQARLLQEAQDPLSQWRQELINEQKRALNLQAQQERLSQERVPQLAQPHPHYSQMPPQPPQGGPSHPGLVERKPLLEERAPTPTLSAIPTSRPGQSYMRNLLGSPAPSMAPTPLHPPMHSSQHPSPPKPLGGFRPSSVPNQSPLQSSLKPVAPPEPRKTSNLASLLNSEPEEPRTNKRMSDHGVLATSRAQSPAPQNLTTNTPAPGSFSRPRGDTFGQPSMQRSMFEQRPPFSHQSQTSQASTPTLKHENSAGGPQNAQQRQDWAPRGSIVPPPPSGSPLLHPGTPVDRERPYFNHRAAAFGPMNGQARSNPSPPPHGHQFTHSRTPSYNQPPPNNQAQQPGNQHGHNMRQPPQGQQQSHILQPNPYAQAPGPASHVQQMHNQQQNQIHHSQNTGPGPGHPLHARHMSREEQMAREEHAYRERERERVEMEREQHRAAEHSRFIAQQQQQQEHQRYGQHRPPAQAMHAPLHQPPPSTFAPEHRLSLREQAEQEANARFNEERLRMDRENRERQLQQEDRFMRQRNDDEMERRRQYEERMREDAYMRRTPQGGGFPPPPHRR